MSTHIGSTTKLQPALRLPSAILFDMDGTLTEPLLNFDQIRRDMGIGAGPILESLKKMNGPEKVAAEKILFDHEDRAARDSTLNPGCRELLQWVEDHNIPTALVTRNTRKSVETVFMQHSLHFDVCITREDGKYKPDPAPLCLACERLKVSPAECWMVGDGNHDIEAGVAAYMTTVWISHGLEKSFAAEPTLTVNNLLELLQILQRVKEKPRMPSAETPPKTSAALQ